MKNSAERLTDTMNYLKSKITASQFQEIQQLLALKPNQAAISDDLSIGHSNPFHAEGRRAKRALMLLSALLIEDQAHGVREVARLKLLPDNSEQRFVADILSWFIRPGVTATHVAVSAKNNIKQMPKWSNTTYFAEFATRGVYDQTRPFNCYNGCLFWAFQAGAISKRYLFNKQGDRDGQGFFPIFSRCGWDTVIEYNGVTLVKDDFAGGEIDVPAGYTIYFEQPHKVFGHVACSLGDGTVISQNSMPITDAVLSTLSPQWRGEITKAVGAITHIVSIRYLLDVYFKPDIGYNKLKVTQMPFWEAYPDHER